MDDDFYGGDYSDASLDGAEPFMTPSHLPVGGDSELQKIFATLTQMRDVQKIVAEHITHPFDIPTPPEKVKKRPDGWDYIENTWMDKSFKSNSPLYTNELVHYSEASGWITVIVRVTDRVTGNSELGGSSVRIQVSKDAGTEITFRDIIDKGNNVAAVISRAIKNAQSRFGHGADIYGKRESVVTDEERIRYEAMLKEITAISQPRAQQFKDGWSKLGVDYSEYLDKWQVFIEKSKPQQK